MHPARGTAREDSFVLPGQCLLHQIAQTAHGGEDRATEVIVTEGDAKVVFQTGEEGQYGHGVEFGQGAEQCGFARETSSAPLQAECAVEYVKDYG